MSMNIQQYRIATDEEVKWFLNATYDDDVSDRWFDDFTKSKQEYKLAKKHNLFIKKSTEFYAASVEGIFNLDREPPTYMAHVTYLRLVKVPHTYFQCGYYMKPCWFNKKVTVSMFDNLKSFNKYCLHYMDLKNPTAKEAIHFVNETYKKNNFIAIEY